VGKVQVSAFIVEGEGLASHCYAVKNMALNGRGGKGRNGLVCGGRRLGEQDERLNAAAG